jgi:hypothetical protein
MAHLFIFLSFQPRLAATLLRSCSVVNNLTRRAGLSPAFQPTSLAQRLTQREFAASVNIGCSTFTSWLRRRRREPVPAVKPWVAVDVVQAPSSSSMVRYQLEWPNGMRVNVNGGFDVREVGQLLNLVRACSP